MDYSNETSGHAAIAVAKYASTASADNYRGAILFNPGGPGVSGVEFLTSGGALFGVGMSIVGSQYDIVSFDPRGSGSSIRFGSGS